MNHCRDLVFCYLCAATRIRFSVPVSKYRKSICHVEVGSKIYIQNILIKTSYSFGAFHMNKIHKAKELVIYFLITSFAPFIRGRMSQNMSLFSLYTSFISSIPSYPQHSLVYHSRVSKSYNFPNIYWCLYRIKKFFYIVGNLNHRGRKSFRVSNPFKFSFIFLLGANIFRFEKYLPKEKEI